MPKIKSAENIPNMYPYIPYNYQSPTTRFNKSSHLSKVKEYLQTLSKKNIGLANEIAEKKLNEKHETSQKHSALKSILCQIEREIAAFDTEKTDDTYLALAAIIRDVYSKKKKINQHMPELKTENEVGLDHIACILLAVKILLALSELRVSYIDDLAIQRNLKKKYANTIVEYSGGILGAAISTAAAGPMSCPGGFIAGTSVTKSSAVRFYLPIKLKDPRPDTLRYFHNVIQHLLVQIILGQEQFWDALGLTKINFSSIHWVEKTEVNWEPNAIYLLHKRELDPSVPDSLMCFFKKEGDNEVTNFHLDPSLLDCIPAEINNEEIQKKFLNDIPVALLLGIFKTIVNHFDKSNLELAPLLHTFEEKKRLNEQQEKLTKEDDGKPSAQYNPNQLFKQEPVAAKKESEIPLTLYDAQTEEKKPSKKQAKKAAAVTTTPSM